jgi:hypothetical protein
MQLNTNKYNQNKCMILLNRQLLLQWTKPSLQHIATLKGIHQSHFEDDTLPVAAFQAAC